MVGDVAEGEEFVIVVEEGEIVREEMVISVFDARVDATALAAVNVVGVSANITNPASTADGGAAEGTAAEGTAADATDGAAAVDVFAIHLSGLMR